MCTRQAALTPAPCNSNNAALRLTGHRDETQTDNGTRFRDFRKRGGVKEYSALRQKHRMEWAVLLVGVLILGVCMILVPATERRLFYFTAILAIGIGCVATAIGGALDVKYTGNKLKAQGTLGLGAFLLVLIVGSLGASWCK